MRDLGEIDILKAGGWSLKIRLRDPSAKPIRGLKGGLGGLLGGAAAGSVLSGGLNDLIKQFQQSGQGDVADSWVGTGPNKQISPNDLASALGADRINSLMAQSGMSREELLNGPEVIDQLTRKDGCRPKRKPRAGSPDNMRCAVPNWPPPRR
jgi:uncharacterized protein YidB (DUF937 family)